jgi:hypothetical protein
MMAVAMRDEAGTGAGTYATERGWVCRVEAVGQTIEAQGRSAQEAEEAVRARLEALVKARGVLPAKVADRTLARLREALERG